MKFSVASYHLPHPEGNAHGRQAHATWEAIRAAGHDVRLWCWGQAPPGLATPDWVDVAPFTESRELRQRLANLRRPRAGLAAAGWRPEAGAIAWAEEPESFAAIADHDRRGLTIAFSALLDTVALRRVRPSAIQSIRAERLAVRSADFSVALSDRVARATAARSSGFLAIPMPATPLELVTDPVALLIADWSWAPNRWALDRLLGHWIEVRRKLPSARLLLAGRGSLPAPTSAGVTVIGDVPQARDAYQQAAVLAFPCPASSGPKVKVLDAMAHGLPVVTTDAGVEGTDAGAALVCRADEFAAGLVAALTDADLRRRLAERGRAAVSRLHAPEAVAAQRLALLGPSSPLAGPDQ